MMPEVPQDGVKVDMTKQKSEADEDIVVALAFAEDGDHFKSEVELEDIAVAVKASGNNNLAAGKMIKRIVPNAAQAKRRRMSAERNSSTGKEYIPDKARRVLGMDDAIPKTTRRAMLQTERRREQEQRRALQEITHAKPTPEQLALPRADRRVSAKALQILGDEGLSQASCAVVTDSDRKSVKSFPKVFQLLGHPALVSPKAQNRCGPDMCSKQRRAQIREEQLEEERRKLDIRRKIKAVLQSRPTNQQLQLPETSSDHQVPEKALRFFGDDRLEVMSQQVVTENMRKNVRPKTLRIFGDSALLTDKERQLLGSLDAPLSPRTEASPWGRLKNSLLTVCAV